MFSGRLKPRLQRKLRGIELRQDLAAEAFDQRILLPFRPLAQCVHRGARLGALAHAFERLVVLVFQQRVEAGGLCLVVQQVGPKIASSRGLGRNGASARNTKWHFGHCPHQRSTGFGPSSLKLRLQLENTSKYGVSFANARVIASSEYGRSSEQ